MEKKPGGKNGSGKKWKKAWWKESLVCFGKDGKKPCVFFLGLIQVKINDEVKLTHSFMKMKLFFYTCNYGWIPRKMLDVYVTNCK